MGRVASPKDTGYPSHLATAPVKGPLDAPGRVEQVDDVGGAALGQQHHALGEQGVHEEEGEGEEPAM